MFQRTLLSPSTVLDFKIKESVFKVEQLGLIFNLGLAFADCGAGPDALIEFLPRRGIGVQGNIEGRSKGGRRFDHLSDDLVNLDVLQRADEFLSTFQPSLEICLVGGMHALNQVHSLMQEAFLRVELLKLGLGKEATCGSGPKDEAECQSGFHREETA